MGEARSVGAERVAGAALVALATLAFALIAGEAFRPRAGFVGDFTQDWLAARDVLAGGSAYEVLPESLRRHLHAEPPEDCLPCNAHPPGSVLLALPLAPLDHHTAFFVWNLVTFPLFVVAVWIVAAELGPWRGWRAAAVAAGVSVAGLTCYPLHQQVVLGQFNALLAFLLAVAWAADRRDRWLTAGAAVGAATAVKLFPAVLMVYLLTARRWRAAGVAVAVALAINAVALAVLGAHDCRFYADGVAQMVSTRFASQWNNLTIRAFWLRLFDPTLQSRVIPLNEAPMLAKAPAAAFRVAVLGAVAWTAWVARTVEARDRAFAVAVVAMVLASPIAWPHYFVMCVVPVGVLVARLRRTRWRWPLFACLALAWLPDTFVPALALGRERAEQMSVHRHEPLSPAQNLLVASVPHYALVGLFLLALRLPVRSDEPR